MKFLQRLDLWDLAIVAGVACLVVGLWELYPPARWIVIGAFLVSVGVRKG